MADNFPWLNQLDQLMRGGQVKPQDRPPGGIPEDDLTDEQKQSLMNQSGGSFEQPPQQLYSGSANPSPWVNQYAEEAAPEAPKQKDPVLASFQPQTQMNQAATSMPDMSGAPSAPPGSPELNAANKNIKTMQDFLNSIDSKNLPGRADQLDTISRLKAYRDAMPVEGEGVNLRPLMAWADSLTPGQNPGLAKQYEDPKTAEDRIDQINKINETISGLSGKMNADDLATLQDKLMGNIALTRFGQDKATAQQAKQQGDMFVKANTDINQMRGNKALQNAQELQRLAANAKAITNMDQYRNNPDAMPPGMIALLNDEVSKIAQGGVASQGTIEGISDPTLRASFSKLVQQVTNTPQGMGQGKFIANKMKYLDDLDAGANNLIRATFERKLSNWAPHLASADVQNLRSNFENEYGTTGNLKNPSNSPSVNAPSAAQTPPVSPQGQGNYPQVQSQASSPAPQFEVGAVARNKKTRQMMKKTADGWVPQ